MLVFVAVVPDFDYFALWLFNINPSPRVTHSLAFCLVVSALAWGIAMKLRTSAQPGITFLALALASSSHLLLDLLVGVHSLPVFWPFTVGEVSSPVGILPSAGRLSVTNYYLWRNLFIECGVLLPILAALVALFRATPARSVLPMTLFLGPLWLACLVWSVGLDR